MEEQEAKSVGSVIFGNFKVVRKLGQGGHGAVYESLDPVLGVVVAVKELLSSNLVTHYQYYVQRFRKEANLISQLENAPNIIRAQITLKCHTPTMLNYRLLGKYHHRFR